MHAKRILQEHYIVGVKKGNVTLAWRVSKSPRKGRIPLPWAGLSNLQMQISSLTSEGLGIQNPIAEDTKIHQQGNL